MNSKHKHNHCYPKVTETGIESNGVLLNSKADIDHTCMCTMSELCKALVQMINCGDNSTKSIERIIHTMTDEQKDLQLNRMI